MSEFARSHAVASTQGARVIINRNSKIRSVGLELCYFGDQHIPARKVIDLDPFAAGCCIRGRLVHHATILEMNVVSYRRRAALDRKRGPGRPPAHATIKKKS
jgi:hypothetical protein